MAAEHRFIHESGTNVAPQPPPTPKSNALFDTSIGVIDEIKQSVATANGPLSLTDTSLMKSKFEQALHSASIKVTTTMVSDSVVATSQSPNGSDHGTEIAVTSPAVGVSPRAVKQSKVVSLVSPAITPNGQQADLLVTSSLQKDPRTVMTTNNNIGNENVPTVTTFTKQSFSVKVPKKAEDSSWKESSESIKM